AVVVEDLALGAADRVHDVVERARRGPPLVPEPLGALDPARIDRGAVDQLVDLVGRPAGGEPVVGRAGAVLGPVDRGRRIRYSRSVLRGDGTPCGGCGKGDDADPQGPDTGGGRRVARFNPASGRAHGTPPWR